MRIKSTFRSKYHPIAQWENFISKRPDQISESLTDPQVLGLDPIPNFNINEDFVSPSFKGFITAGTVSESEKMKEWLGIKYEGNIYYKGNHCPGQVLRNCVHPELGGYVLSCLYA